MTNRFYDILNDIAKIGIPATTALYAALAIVWNWPYVEGVVATGAAVATFLGVWLKILQNKYVPPTDGVIDIDASSSDAAKVRLALDDSDVFAHSNGDVVRLKVSSNVERYKDQITDNFSV